MKNDDAKILSEQLLQITFTLAESIEFVRARSTEEDSEEYTKAMGRVLANIYWHITDPLWEKHPSLKPDNLGGPYKVDIGSFESVFLKRSPANEADRFITSNCQ